MISLAVVNSKYTTSFSGLYTTTEYKPYKT